MELTIKREELNEKLNIVSKAISTKAIVPILTGIKFDLKETGLFLTTSNDDIAIETFIDKKKIKNIGETGSIIIPGIYFLSIIRKLDDKYITMSTDGLNINITTTHGEYSLNGMNPNEFPNIKFNLLDKPVKLQSQILKNIINQTSFAVSTQESRPVLTGINFQIEKDKLECIATDSYRLAKKIVFLDKEIEEHINVVIPGRNLIELNKLLAEDEEEIEMHIFSNSVLFKTKELLFQSRLLNDNYPDVSKLIPTDFEVTIKVDLMDFYNTLDRVSLLTDEKDKNLVKMVLKDKELTLTSTSQEIGKMEETMKITKDNDIDMTIAYSSKYMMEALRTLKCNNIDIRLNSEIKPIIIKNTEDDNLIQLILPIKTF